MKINEKLSNKKLKISLLLGFLDNIGFKINQSIIENIYPVDPITKLLTNYEEIKEILNMKDKNIIKYLYFNRYNITKILYNNEENIFVDFVGIKKNISFYFYLDLLIRENQNIVEYTYSIDFIKEIHNLQKNNNDKIYQKIILSKLIIELIKNYKGFEIYDGKEEEVILNDIEKENEVIIDKNIKIFNEKGLNLAKEDIISINSKKLDEIYIKIIIELIKQKKFEDFEYINKIINELDLENINITKIMFDELSKFLYFNEKYINDYMINSADDLLNKKNINFYYILFNKIIKNSIYIYQNSFLYNIRKSIINILKSDSEKLYNFLEKSSIEPKLKDKINYLIKTFTDTEYYFVKYINKINIENNSNINNQQINIITLDSLDKIAENLLNNSSFTFEINEMNINKTLLNNKIIYKRKQKKNENEIEIEYEDLKSIKKGLNINSKLRINFNRFLVILEDFANSLKNNLINKNNFNINFEFKRNTNEKEKNNLYNINLKYKLLIEKEEKYFEDEDILNIVKLENADGFLYLLEEINQN